MAEVGFVLSDEELGMGDLFFGVEPGDVELFDFSGSRELLFHRCGPHREDAFVGGVIGLELALNDVFSISEWVLNGVDDDSGLRGCFLFVSRLGRIRTRIVSRHKLRLFCRHLFPCPELIPKPKGEGGAGGEATTLGVAEDSRVDLLQLHRLVSEVGDGIGEVSADLLFRALEEEDEIAGAIGRPPDVGAIRSGAHGAFPAVGVLVEVVGDPGPGDVFVASLLEQIVGVDHPGEVGAM